MRPLLGQALAAAILCLLAGCDRTAGPATAKDDLGLVRDFSLTERGGQEVHRSDLVGKVWVAAFIFTRCAGPCTHVSGTMARLQHDLSGSKDVVLVSFTVDPEFDKPAVLRQYATRYGADPQRWLFLTGDPEKIYPLIHDGFHLAAEQNQGEDRKPGYEVMHSTRLALVDGQGHIRGYYDAKEPEAVERLEKRIPELSAKRFGIGPEDLPAVNAILNGTSAILLVLGYAAIRRRAIRLHKACMLSALGVSALFLASYLYYHFVVRHGQPTHFTGPGLSKPIYFAILTSHTLLAIVVAPLALYTAYQGVRDQLARHVKIARWTMPIWLYVSITGVVVYWMLYQLYPSR